MKRIVVAVLAFVLTGCAGLAPAAAPTTASTASPVVIVQTVLVTVIPTQMPTEVATATPLPTLTPQVIVVTATYPVEVPFITASPQFSSGLAASAVTGTVPLGPATATLPINAGGEIFTNLTRSTDHFSLRCQPGTLTLGLSTSNPYVVEVDLFYRIEDRMSVSISEWKNAGKMQTDKNGNFILDFPASGVNPDLRSHKGWFDYEFVGVNKLGDVVGRSAIIPRQVTYIIDCSD